MSREKYLPMTAAEVFFEAFKSFFSIKQTRSAGRAVSVQRGHEEQLPSTVPSPAAFQFPTNELNKSCRALIAHEDKPGLSSLFGTASAAPSSSATTIFSASTTAIS
jgi:hypothetical protein